MPTAWARRSWSCRFGGLRARSWARLAPKSTATDLFGNASEDGVWVPIKTARVPSARFHVAQLRGNSGRRPDGDHPRRGDLVERGLNADRPDTSWSTLDGAGTLPDAQVVHLTMTVNRPLEGSAYLYDNSASSWRPWILSPLVEDVRGGQVARRRLGENGDSAGRSGRDPQGCWCVLWGRCGWCSRMAAVRFGRTGLDRTGSTPSASNGR